MRTIIHRNFKNIARIFLIGCLLVSYSLSLDAQRRTHNLGDYEYTVDIRNLINMSSQPDFTSTGTWPQDHYRYGTVVYHLNAVIVGKYIDTLDVEVNNYLQIWPTGAAGRTIQEYRRHAPPNVYVNVDGELVPSSRPFDGIVDPDLPADMMVKLTYKTVPGFDITNRSYSFANQNHNDYVIQHNQIIMNFDWNDNGLPNTDTTQVVEDVYFVVGYGFQVYEGTIMTQTNWPSESKGDWASFDWVNSTLVPGAGPFGVSYGWNGDHPDVNTFESGGKDFDNTGNPRYGIGLQGTTPMPSAEFVSSAYGGFAALDVNVRSVGNRPNNAPDIFPIMTQPRSVKSSMNISHWWDRSVPGFASWRHFAESGSIEHAQDIAGWPNNPGVTPGNLCFQVYGPFNLAYRDTVNIVFAVGANGISRDLAEEKGREWLAWYRGEAGATFDDAAKNQLIATGRDSLFQSMDRAFWAWHQGLNIPAALPSPDLFVTPLPNYVELEWAHPAYPNVDHYRVYRKRGEFLVDTHGELRPDGVRRKWELIATVPRGESAYEDYDVVRGEPYYYAVTIVDDGSQNTHGLFPGQKLESSRYSNRSRLSAMTFEPGEPTTDNIRIVPNPYIFRAGEFNFADDNKLLFVNLPPFCTIRIYNVTGDLIKTIQHTTGRADAAWDQVTEYNQLIASGVYILHVSNARDIDGNPLRDTFEKFVVIR
jgi:hypothetical protein